MKYKRLVVTNFKSFYGKNEFSFSTSKDKPITVFFGLNGSGKTALIGAMYWGLFGLNGNGKIQCDPNLDVHHGDNGEYKFRGLFNFKASAELEPGETTECGVEVHFDHNDVEYRVSRTLVASKDSSGNVEIKEKNSSPQLIKVFNNEPETLNGTAIVTKQIESVCSSALAPFIYHSAENLNNPFSALASDSNKLKDVIFQVVGTSDLTEIEKQAKSALKKLTDNTRDLQKGIDEFRQAGKDLESLQEKKEEYEEKISDLEDDIEGYETQKRSKLTIMQAVEELKPLTDAVQETENSLAAEKVTLEERKNLVRVFSKNLWMIQAQPLVKDFANWFAEHHEHFPLKINQNLIQYMRKTDKCVCGKEISAAEIKAIENQIDAEDDEIASYVTNLFNRGKQFSDEATEIKNEFNSARANVQTTADLVEAHEEELTRRKDRVTQFSNDNPEIAVQVEGIDVIISDHDKLVNDINVATGKISGLKVSLDTISRDISDLERLIGEQAPLQLKVALARQKLASDFLKMVTKLKEEHARACTGEFEKLMNEHYRIMRADRKIVVTEDFHLKTVASALGDELHEIGGSGAETSLIRFAFAAALTRLIPGYKVTAGNLSPGSAVETLPFVVDAPFSNFGDEYIDAISESLPTMAEQTIIFNTASKHLLPKFEEMGDKIGKRYKIKLYGEPAENLPEAAASFEFENEEHNYWDMDYDGMNYSEVIPLG